MKVITSTCEQQFIENCIRKGIRQDGRGLNDGRSIEIAFSKEDGCCFVMYGGTRVLAQVSCEVSAPRPSRPSEGALYVNLELSPMAAPDFKSGMISDAGIEASRLLERCIRDSRCIDMESLCIVSGMKVWLIRVDVQALNNDGNLIECASVATICALAHFKRPHVSVVGTDVTVHSLEDHNPVPLTLHHMPVIVNIVIFEEGKYIVVDPLELEERTAPGKIVIGVNAHQEICALHLSGPLVLSKNTVLQCSNIAVKRAQTLTQIIRKALDDDAYKRATKQLTGFVSLLHGSSILGTKRRISQVAPSVESQQWDEDDAANVDESSEEEMEEEPNIEIEHSAVKQEVKNFLESPQVALFQGGTRQWYLKADESSEEEGECEDSDIEDIKPIVS